MCLHRTEVQPGFNAPKRGISTAIHEIAPKGLDEAART